MRSLQEFAAVHASVSIHFDQERKLSGRDIFKLNRAAALAEWRALLAAYGKAILPLWKLVRFRLPPPTDRVEDPLDIGVEAIDLGETLCENLEIPLEDYLRGQVGLPPSGPPRPGIHTGEPYDIFDNWSGQFAGQICLDPARSSFG